jgi:serine/threonine protein kinase/DNA-binding winged helix-turn-helix (wHTH) protein
VHTGSLRVLTEFLRTLKNSKSMASNAFQGGSPAACGRVWSFADCEFDDARLELRVRCAPVELELKPLEVLQQLLLHAGEVVSKEQLLDSVWPGLMVVDGSLATAVSKLRKALGDTEAPVVLTVPRVGYRLGVPVHSRPAVPEPFDSALDCEAGEPVPGRRQWRLVRPFAAPETRQVWLAENPKTREQRVFKFASKDTQLRHLKREVTVSRFLREALGPRADFVRLLEWSFDAQPYCIESEYGGLNLAEWAEAQGGLTNVPLQTRLDLLKNMATAVAAAHQAGVIHKDLKPSNILVDARANGDRQVKVADFGSASLIEPEKLREFGITNLGETQTAGPRSSYLTGTLLYLAPEVLSGNAPTAAADIYALGVMLYQIVIGDFRKPLSPGWESDVADPVLREDIAEAACGDPARRLRSASEFASRLEKLEQRRAEHEKLQRAKEREEFTRRKMADARARRPWMVFAAVALAIAITLSFTLYRRVFSSNPRSMSVAVLPFQNAASDSSIDFLQLALPDQITTTLGHMKPLVLRPFSGGGKHAQGNSDLQQLGREIGVSSIVTGHFLVAEKNLQVTIEVIDVESNKLRWRDTVNIPAGNLLALQAQMSGVTRGKVAPVLGATELVRTTPANPRNEQAYDLYVRTLPISADPLPNKQALAMLEQSVVLDPDYPPAWEALSLRAYSDSRSGGGGDAMLRRSDYACERALALDPDSIGAASELALHRAERGELVRAYQEADALARRHPDSAVAHHLVNYVLRYAGALDEAGKQCDITSSLDPLVGGSCATTFMEAGNYRRALDFIRKDYSSEWSRAHAVEIFVRAGRNEEALKIGPPKVAEWENSYKMLLTCVAHGPSTQIADLATKVQSSDDPEVSYFFAGHLAFCGQTNAALRMLDSAVKAKYCSYPAMESDPLFANIRGFQEFSGIRARGSACNRNFRAEITQAQ